MSTKRRDSVRVTTLVSVDRETAFSVFTEEIGSWWRREARYHFNPKELRFEERRLMCGDFEIGEASVWEPGERLVLSWRQPDFDAEMTTEVEVSFEPEGDLTRVSVEHRGWDRIPSQHASRHGTKKTDAFTGLLGLWWADLLNALKARTG